MISLKKKREKLKKKENKANSNFKNYIIKIIFIFLAIILIIFATQYVFKGIETKEAVKQQEIEVKEKEENIKKLSENKTYKNLDINNIKIYEKYGNTYFSAKIENKSKNKFKKKNIVFNFVDKEGKSIVKFGYLINEIKAGEKVEIKIITNEDLTKAYDFKIEE